jgi:hypothetical protein
LEELDIVLRLISKLVGSGIWECRIQFPSQTPIVYFASLKEFSCGAYSWAGQEDQRRQE